MQKSNKQLNNSSSTIVAIATSTGVGGVHIVRISGIKALSIAKKILNIKKDLEPRFATFTSIQEIDFSDNVIVIYFKAPHSFTGEDVVEIHCHGNILISSIIVDLCIENGATMAEPGQFSRRAFLNNKMDLSSSESLLDLIHASSLAGVREAYKGLEGGIFNVVDSLCKKLVSSIAHLSAWVDYPEDDLIEASINKALGEIEPVIKGLNILRDSYKSGLVRKNGVNIAIIGAPNVGKSMLLNSLLGYKRAIVSSTAGTTRDTLNDSYIFKDILFNIVDTAGIRLTKNKIEKLGVERSISTMESADVLLCVSCANSEFDYTIIKNKSDKKVIFVVNKSDLLNDKQRQSYLSNIKKEVKNILISAKNNDNIDALKNVIYDISVTSVNFDGISLNNARHYSATIKAIEAIERAINISQGISIDCMLSDLSEALRSLSSITGAVASESVVDEIFSKFCVGK